MGSQVSVLKLLWCFETRRKHWASFWHLRFPRCWRARKILSLGGGGTYFGEALKVVNLITQHPRRFVAH